MLYYYKRALVTKICKKTDYKIILRSLIVTLDGNQIEDLLKI